MATLTERRKAARAERIKEEYRFLQERRTANLAAEREMARIVKVLFSYSGKGKGR